MRSDLIHLFNLALVAVAQQSHGGQGTNANGLCNPLPTLNSEGQYQAILKKKTVYRFAGTGCTDWFPVNENNYCGPQQVQAYAYKVGTKEYANTLWVSVTANHEQTPITHTAGAYTATTYHTGHHVKGELSACTDLAPGVEAVDLFLRVIYWPSTPSS